MYSLYTFSIYCILKKSSKHFSARDKYIQFILKMKHAPLHSKYFTIRLKVVLYIKFLILQHQSDIFTTYVFFLLLNFLNSTPAKAADKQQLQNIMLYIKWGRMLFTNPTCQSDVSHRHLLTHKISYFHYHRIHTFMFLF